MRCARLILLIALLVAILFSQILILRSVWERRKRTANLLREQEFLEWLVQTDRNCVAFAGGEIRYAWKPTVDFGIAHCPLDKAPVGARGLKIGLLGVMPH